MLMSEDDLLIHVQPVASPFSYFFFQSLKWDSLLEFFSNGNLYWSFLGEHGVMILKDDDTTAKNHALIEQIKASDGKKHTAAEKLHKKKPSESGEEEPSRANCGDDHSLWWHITYYSLGFFRCFLLHRPRPW